MVVVIYDGAAKTKKEDGKEKEERRGEEERSDFLACSMPCRQFTLENSTPRPPSMSFSSVS